MSERSSVIAVPANSGRERAVLVFIGSSGYLEIAVRGKSAAGLLGADTGEKVHVRMPS